MSRHTLKFIAVTVATCVANFGFAAGPNLDIAGIKIGASEDDAVAALKAHNPALMITQNAHRLNGISKPLRPAVVGDGDGEKVTMVFTMPPGPENCGAFSVRPTTSRLIGPPPRPRSMRFGKNTARKTCPTTRTACRR